MSCDVPYWGMRARQSRPLIPSEKHHGGKSTALKGDMQGREGFFCMGSVSEFDSNAMDEQRKCRLAIGGKRRSARRGTDGLGQSLSITQPLVVWSK